MGVLGFEVGGWGADSMWRSVDLFIEDSATRCHARQVSWLQKPVVRKEPLSVGLGLRTSQGRRGMQAKGLVGQAFF